MLLLLKNRVELGYRQINITKYVNQSNQQQIISTNYKTDNQYNKVIKKNNFRLGIVFTIFKTLVVPLPPQTSHQIMWGHPVTNDHFNDAKNDLANKLITQQLHEKYIYIYIYFNKLLTRYTRTWRVLKPQYIPVLTLLGGGNAMNQYPSTE